MSLDLRVGFIGAGKMAVALAKGLVDQGVVEPARLLASDPVAAAREEFQNKTGGATAESNLAVAKQSNVLILAVKPGQVRGALGELQGLSNEDRSFLSIAAGITIAQLQNGLGPAARIVRVMPNTPALVGSSASAFALGPSATPEDAAIARRIFGAVGLVCEVPEPLLDAVTGLSGSGPAYVYLVIEALSDGGVAAGLPRETATRLAAQTVLGAARMVLETGSHPGVLKDMVTSPGGTTIEGLHALEKAGVRGAFIGAVRAAAEKAASLGRRS